MKYQVFKFKSKKKDRAIVWIPLLQKLYTAPISNYDLIPPYIIENQDDIKREFNIRDEKKENYQFNSATLFLTTKCNLQCVYCYEKSRPWTGENMKEEIAFAAIDYIVYWATRKTKTSYLSFFGGEPTLAWPLLTESVEYYKKRNLESNCRYGIRITTNGNFSEKEANWLAENIEGITISLDGMKNIHDKQRNSSFDRVFYVSRLIYEIAPHKLSFRITITRDSVNFLPEICKFFGENFPRVILNFEPVEPCPGERYQIFTPSHNLFFKKFIESIPIAKLYELRIRTSVSMISVPHSRFCGIGESNFMVLPDGRVTACNRMLGNDEVSSIFIYGYYDERLKRFKFDDKKYNFLKKLNVDSIPDCENCIAKYSCCGDCPATKAVLLEDKGMRFYKMRSPYCEAIKEFTKELLEYVVDNGYKGLVLA